MAYARDDIDKVRERTDLAELAAEVTKVKRSGRSVMAVCPFHNEKTPSLSIDPARGLEDVEVELGPGGALEGRVLVPTGPDPAGIIPPA